MAGLFVPCADASSITSRALMHGLGFPALDERDGSIPSLHDDASNPTND
jgi:hypothetical protein